MDLTAAPTADVGQRIGHYRNSIPRSIKVLGLGRGGGRAVRGVAELGFPNVDVAFDEVPEGWAEAGDERPEARANMVVVVCDEGDEPLFRPEHATPGVLVTLVVLRSDADVAGARERSAVEARSFSDLFVTTSDADYVPDLIANLAR